MTVGLDPFNPRSVSQIADRTTLIAMLAATNTITVGSLRGFEAERELAKFAFFRAGNVNRSCPLHRRRHGAGGRISRRSRHGDFGVGQTSATVEVLPEQDGQFEPAETVIAGSRRIRPTKSARRPPQPSRSMTRLTSFMSLARCADGNKSGGYGTAGHPHGGNVPGDVAVSFGNLGSAHQHELHRAYPSGADLPPARSARRPDSPRGFTRDQIRRARSGPAHCAIARRSIRRAKSAACSQELGWRIPPSRRNRPDCHPREDRWRGRAIPHPGNLRSDRRGHRRVKKIGYPAWIEEQFRKPTTLHLPNIAHAASSRPERWEDDGGTGVRQSLVGRRHRRARPAPPALAFALSEIFVA
jgi:hypothetical protein